MIDEAGIRPGDLVLDIGAGTGAITAGLVAVGARVVAVELHDGRVRALRHRFGDRIVVVHADARDLRLPRRPFRVVANPPFAATAAILRRLVSAGSRLHTADLVVPSFVAQRWAAHSAPGAGRWAGEFAVGVRRRVPCSAFTPPAPAPTAVLRIQRRV